MLFGVDNVWVVWFGCWLVIILIKYDVLIGVLNVVFVIGLGRIVFGVVVLGVFVDLVERFIVVDGDFVELG